MSRRVRRRTSTRQRTRALVVNQWTDANGQYAARMDGTNRWWNGTDWQKV